MFNPINPVKNVDPFLRTAQTDEFGPLDQIPDCGLCGGPGGIYAMGRTVPFPGGQGWMDENIAVCVRCSMMNKPRCDECGNFSELMYNWAGRTICVGCYGGSTNNIDSYQEVSDAIMESQDMGEDPFTHTIAKDNYYQTQYGSIFEPPEDMNRKQKKSWRKYRQYFENFDMFPEMMPEVTKPSEQYEGTYIEFPMVGSSFDSMVESIAEKVGGDAKSIRRDVQHLMEDFNDEHPCLVSEDPMRLITSRVLVTEDGNWEVKLMQGSVNGEARKEVSRIKKDIANGEEYAKCNHCTDGKIVTVYPAGNVTRTCGACYGRGRDHERPVSEDAKKIPLLQGIVDATNGAYIAAYDYLIRLAQFRGVQLHVATPDQQANQHPAASKLDLTMVYGGIPSLMGFGAKGQGKEKRRIAVDLSLLETIIEGDFDPLLE